MKQSSKPLLTILIPAVNEEKVIEKMVKDCLKLKKYKIDPLVVIDSKTVDDTKTVAEKAGARVIHVGKGSGKGTAFRKAIPYVKGQYTVQLDADYQFLPADIPKLVEPLFKNYDITLGTRYQKGALVEKGSVTMTKRFGSYFLSLMTSLVSGITITDVMAGCKGFKTDVLKKLPIKTDHFGYEAELVILAAKKRFKIRNIPITYKKRTEGISNVHSVKHGFLVLETIIKTAFRKIN